MKAPFIELKLMVPSPPAAYLSRPRLDRAFASWDAMRLVLVTAGAGFGKTSFLAANARRSPRPTFWYALEESDGDIARFGVHIEELARRLGERSALAAVPTDAEYGERILAQLVRALHENPNRPILIFDDLQLLGVSPARLRWFERLVRFIPEETTLILAAREPVAIATMKQRARGVVARLGGAELRFTTEEVAALFARHFPRAELAAPLLHRIVEVTEGWAAGIEILFQVIDGSSARAVTQALTQIERAGSDWFSYFAEEVIGDLDEQTRDFLLRSAVLPRQEAALCDRVLGMRSSERILSRLSERNLFTFAEGSGPGTYRYHHLFREFLRDQLKQSLEPESLGALQVRAAQVLQDAGQWAEAAAAYAEGDRPSETLKLIERLGEDLLATGQHEVVRRALESIPAEQIAARATALYVLGRLHEIQGRYEEARRVYRQALAAGARGAERIELLMLIARLEMRRGAYEESTRLCKEALQQGGRRKMRQRGRLYDILGVSAAAAGRLDEAESYLNRAREGFRRAEDAEGEGRICYLLAANVYFWRGQFERAKEAARRAVVLFKKRGNPREVCHSLGVLGFVMVAAGELREGRELVTEALRMAERLGYRAIEGYCQYTLGRCAMLARDPVRAPVHLQAALKIGQDVEDMSLQTLPLIATAEVALAQGDHHAARRAASRALKYAREAPDILQEALCRTTLGLVEIGTAMRKARNHWRRAAEVLDPLGALFAFHRLEILRLAEGDVPAKDAPERLRRLLVAIAAAGHRSLFLIDEPQRGARLLARAIADGIEVPLARGLLIELGESCVEELVPLMRGASETVRIQALEILAQIGGERARRLLAAASDGATRPGRIARGAAEELGREVAQSLQIGALGPLTVKVGKRRLTRTDWRSARALRLFQLLLVHRFRWVPRDVVIDALWPEADPAKGANNLRQTIHVLRKTLEPGLKKAIDSSYIRFRNEACRLAGGQGVRYDVVTFERAISEGEEHCAAGEPEAAEKLLRRAVRLYRDEFLCESPYEDFLADQREYLRERFLRAIAQLTLLHHKARRFEDLIPLCRRGLAVDPYDESLHRRLILGHLRLGHRREALAAYHRYEEMMIRELDLLPTEPMKALADEILALGASPAVDEDADI